jgi:glucosamine--fructose-6-phosphate aminotransferase (isomerizing)
MCGIIVYSKKNYKRQDFTILKKLYSISSRRGSQSCGISIYNYKNNNLYIKKIIGTYNQIFNDKKVNSIFNYNIINDEPTCIIGHTRMQTDGDYNNNYNNQPVVTKKSILVHNGIVCNYQNIINNSKFIAKTELDSEVISILLDTDFKTKDIISIFSRLNNTLIGTVNIVYKNFEDDNLYIYTNNGSLYYYFDKTNEIFICLSEFSFFKSSFKNTINQNNVIQLQPNELLVFSSKKNEVIKYNINDVSGNKLFYEHNTSNILIDDSVYSESNKNYNNSKHTFKNVHDKVSTLSRCSKCILPETFPFIQFDEHGVCNYCKNYQKISFLGKNRLILDLTNNNLNTPNLLVTLSGGRDSCYGLHFVNKVLGYKTTAYSYDWGLVTDLARRNQARFCQKLGIEHILVSADINTKRKNVKMNLEAWLNNPNIGIIPLLIAGDKQYFEFANIISKEVEATNVILCENMLETTHFKTGYLGIEPNFNSEHTFSLSSIKKIQLFNFYLSEFIKNPLYLNTSILDSARAFIVYYFSSKNYINLFNYIPWDEKEIENTLLNEYGWELSPDTKTTWRIGDGTAAFYNYIYFIYGGFTEFDTFRSNQIREGQISRESALKLVSIENQTREDSFLWYCDTIGIDRDLVFKGIDKLKVHPYLK